ncbi:dTMP kinase [candidate division WWE3 bacterium]|nr:dTMP kinase [candidate division WWE3 bacterium]
MYIVFEGVIGTGKTTQSKKYLDYLKNKFPQKQIVWTREPGGDEIADSIRKLAQSIKFEQEMVPICEAYLYAASRAQALRTIAQPVLDAGGIVISDRNFLSSLTNQAYGRDLSFDTVLSINKEAISGFMPDKIVFLDLPIREGIQRSFDKDGDKFESLGEDFYELVYQGYKEISIRDEFKDCWINIDAKGSTDEVYARIVKSLKL